jgi:hypothetical protein
MRDDPGPSGWWAFLSSAALAIDRWYGCGDLQHEYRHAIERMPPRHYLTASYYERSLPSLATLLTFLRGAIVQLEWRQANPIRSALLRFRLQSHCRLGGCSAARCGIHAVG